MNSKDIVTSLVEQLISSSNADTDVLSKAISLLESVLLSKKLEENKEEQIQIDTCQFKSWFKLAEAGVKQLLQPAHIGLNWRPTKADVNIQLKVPLASE
jgi:hypothetical protein